MRFAYTRSGGPLLNWSGPTPPSPTRAGETRSLGDWYSTTRTSGAMRRYGGRLAPPGGSAVPYEVSRQLGAYDLPRPGAPEVVEGYESPAPGAAVVHLGGGRSSASYPWNEKYPGQTSFGHSLSGYMPEGAARSYGQAVLSADPAPKQFDMGIVRKAAVLAAAYHGVKRHNGSVLWGLLWGIAAYVSPLYGVLVPAIGVAQGFGQAKGPKQNPARRRAGNRYRRRAGGRGLKRGAKARRARMRRAANKIRRQGLK